MRPQLLFPVFALSLLLGHAAAGQQLAAPILPTRADSLRRLAQWPATTQARLAATRLLPGTPEAAAALAWQQRGGAGLPPTVYLDLQASLGRYYLDNNQFGQAVHELLAVRHQTQTDSVRGSNAALWLCYASLRLNQPQAARDYGEEALRRLPRQPATRNQLRQTYTILASVATGQRDYHRGEQLMRAALRLNLYGHYPTIERHRLLASGYLNLASTQRNGHHYAAAQRSLDSARTFFPVAEPAVEIQLYEGTAALALAQHRYRAAELALRPAQPLLAARPLWETEVLTLLANALKGQRRYRAALGCQERLRQLDAVAYEARAQRNAQQLQAAYAAAKRQQQLTSQRRRIERLQAAQQLNQARYGRRLAALGAGTLLVMLLGLLGGLAWSHRQRRLRLAREAQLRTRIAADLHDEVGTLLARVSMQADLLSQQQLPEAANPALARLLGNSRAAARTMRDIVWSIDAHADTVGALVDRMRDHLDQTAAPAGLHTHLHTDHLPDELPLPPELRQHLYLVFKEAVTNAVRHAVRPTGLSVRLTHQPDHTLRLAVEDDGQPSPQPPGRSGMGLRNMHQRAAALRGELLAGPQPGGGFRVQLTAPLR